MHFILSYASIILMIALSESHINLFIAAAKNEPPVNTNAFSQHDHSGDGATVAKPGLPPRPKGIVDSTFFQL